MEIAFTDTSWKPSNRERLERLIAEHAGRPDRYIVVDWDNTSIFRDIEDVVLDHQLRTLTIAPAPDAFTGVLGDGLPMGPLAPSHLNAAGEQVAAEALIADISAAYRWLRTHDGADHPDEAAQRDALRSKLRFLYEAIDATFGHTFSCRWITRMFTGMTPDSVHTLTREAVRAQHDTAIGEVTWTSPDELAGEAGVVSSTWETGLRMVAPMQELYRTCRAHGIEVYVVSASFVEIVREVATHPEHGYALDPECIFGMMLTRADEGVFTHRPPQGVPPTQAKGKTATIRTYISPRHSGRGPILVAGDSDGDADMLSAFSDTEVRLVINRVKAGAIGELAGHHHTDADVLLQGRDEHAGCWRPSCASVLLDEDEEQLHASQVAGTRSREASTAR